MPVPKGVNKDKYDRCVKQVKQKQGEKVNAYAICNSSMKKSEEKKVEENKETPAVAAPAPEATATKEPEVRIASNLFKEFTLGSKLAAGITGNIMTNLKAPSMDYEKTYKQSTKNQVMTSEELKALNQKKDK